MKINTKYLLDRLKEKSTWVSIIGFFSSLGVLRSDIEMKEPVIGILVGIVSIIQFSIPDAKKEDK